MDSALKDLASHRSLPGLPSLDKPVFVVKGSTVCLSDDALINPNANLTIFAGACAVVGHDKRVSVISPTDSRAYITDHYWQIVAITFRSGAVSDANVYTAWVKISALRN